MLQMKTLPLGEYQTNCYLLWNEGSEECIVIDPGYEPDTVLLQTRLIKKKIAAILLTHGHFDHVGGVRAIAEQTGCAVYLQENDLSVPHRFTAGPLFYTDTYAEGDVLELAGLQLRVLQTPGHTPGCVCLLCEDHMFSGDTLFMDSCGRTDLPGGNHATIMQSLKRLRDLPGNYAVHPGHGPSTTLDDERKWNPYLR